MRLWRIDALGGDDEKVDSVFTDSYMVTYEKRNMKDYVIFKEMEWNP